SGLTTDWRTEAAAGPAGCPAPGLQEAPAPHTAAGPPRAGRWRLPSGGGRGGLSPTWPGSPVRRSCPPRHLLQGAAPRQEQAPSPAQGGAVLRRTCTGKKLFLL
ncbi:hypothetical protein KIL84_007742, partial [Mauremys mutica]